MLMPMLLAAALAQDTDTTVAVRPGTRLDVNNHAGSVVVRAWTRSEVRVRATLGTRDRMELDYSGATLSVEATGRHGPAFAADFEISVPEWMKVEVSGVETDITVEGTKATITAETVEGAVTVKGGAEFVNLHSVEGDVTVEGGTGKLQINTVDGGVILRNVGGDITVEAVDGDIEMTGISAANVDVYTVDGDITFEGVIKDGGRYRLSSHDGDLDVTIPERTNAQFRVSTFDGDFVPNFAIQPKTEHRRILFTLGSGSAQVELESFDGTITLNQAGARRREE